MLLLQLAPVKEEQMLLRLGKITSHFKHCVLYGILKTSNTVFYRFFETLFWQFYIRFNKKSPSKIYGDVSKTCFTFFPKYFFFVFLKNSTRHFPYFVQVNSLTNLSVIVQKTNNVSYFTYFLLGLILTFDLRFNHKFSKNLLRA